MGSNPHRIAILLVDDDPDCRAVFRDVLEWDGYRVMEACNGLEALDVCARDLPEVIVVDSSMPIMTGSELAAALSADQRYASIPLIIVSGHDAVILGNVFARLNKPISSAELRSTVRACLAARDSDARRSRLLAK